MTASETQALLLATQTKLASRKVASEKQEKVAQKDTSKAEKVANALDYLNANFDLVFGSPIQRAIKTAGDLDVPNTVSHSASSGPAGKPINETRDSMAVGEEPAEQKGAPKGGFEGVPNVVSNTANKRPGGASENPADPPLFNKSAFDKVLAKLAKNKTAGDLDIPNQTRVMKDTDSGKGQSGYDSGSSNGNNNRHLVDTDNRKAMDYDKGEAKRQYNKEQMSQVMDEVHPEKDKALDRAFEHGVEGAKLAHGVPGLGNMISGGAREAASSVGNAVRGAGASALGNAAGVVPTLANKGEQALGAASNIAARGQQAIVQDPRLLAALAGGTGLGVGGAAGYALGKQANLEEAKKMEAMAKKEVAEEKKEEKVSPGIHDKIEKTACGPSCKGCKECRPIKKAAQILRKLAEDVPTNAPAAISPDATNQVAPPPEAAQATGGQEDQIEKLKKLLLLMQMAKKQEMEGMQTQTPDVTSPGAGSASEVASAVSGPTQGVM